MFGEQFKFEKIDRSRNDIVLVSLIIFLLGLGLCVIYSVTYRSHVLEGADVFAKQLKATLFFAIPTAFLALIDIKKLRIILPYLAFLMALMLILTLTKQFGVEVKGAQRWLQLGPIRFQPSELLKPFIVVYAAHLIDNQGEKFQDFTHGFLIASIKLFFFIGLLIFEKDLSTTIVIVGGIFTMFFLGGCRWSHFMGLIALCLVGFLIYVLTQDYAGDRFFVWNQSEEGRAAWIGTQPELASRAWIAGGVLGEGLGTNVMDYNNIPEAESDFIVATLARSIGLLGISGLIGLFAFLGYKVFNLSWKLREEKFLFLVGVGSISMILIQVIINIAVNAALIPTTGIPCPFFSTGTSSLIGTMIFSGLILSLPKYVEGNR